jgi:putative glutamine amidotransferase
MTIGLTYTGYGEKHQNYVKWLKGNDANIDVIKLTAEGDPDAIAQCDALVLSGGVDIHPEMYGGDRTYPKRPAAWKKDRDVFEQSVFEYALKHALPVLGVCRGLQLINVCMAGTLIQDLGNAGDETHEGIKDKDKQHLVRVIDGTLLFDIAGESAGEVNSAHHQAIGKLGEGLRINCRAEDGTIEGIEWADPAGKPFLLGVQWHPERMFNRESPLTANVRKVFLSKITQRLNKIAQR